MSMVIVEHKSHSYAPRTFHNAYVADLTVAIAVDHSTAGELLTRRSAGKRFLALNFGDSAIDNARLLFADVKKRRVRILNVAGNGIYTFTKSGIQRETVHQYVYNVLQQVHQFYPIAKIVSGGQTGVDIAGAMTAYKLGIDMEITFPKGFRQRNEQGQEVYNTYDQIVEQIKEGAGRLV